MKEFDTAQVEQLKTIGDYLGRERQEKDISLDEIAIKTYIPLRLLQALELGHVERLPEPVFVQGFIRRYADAIGLDGMALAKTFSPQPSFMVERQTPEVERRPHTGDQPNVGQPNTVAKPAVEPIHLLPESAQRNLTSGGGSSYPAWLTRSPALPWLLIGGGPGSLLGLWLLIRRDRTPRAAFVYLSSVLLGTAAALVAGVGVIYVLSRPNALTEPQLPQPNTSQPSPSTRTPQPDVATNSKRSPSAQGSPSPLPIQAEGTPAKESTATADSSIQVAVNLTDESWFQVVADGKVEFEGTLKKGEQKTWTAKKTLVLQAGNAGAVSVSYNQGEAKRLGTLGEVKEVTFAAKAKPGSVN